MNIKNRKILVTGGAGFIGSNLVDSLVKKGYKVLVVDNFSTGKKKNLEKSKNKITIINIDLSTPLNSMLKRLKQDIGVIYHLAALPRIGRSIDNPLETHRANVNTTLNVLELGKLLNVKKFIYTSSSSVYGTQKEFPITENARENPENPYATQKFIGEEYCRIYQKVYGLKTYVMRLFNVYGKRMATDGAYKLVITNWTQQIKANKKITIYGDGKQTRDFTHVSDIVRGLIKVLESNENINGPVNLCTGVETSINKLAEYFDWKVEYIKNPRLNEEKRKYGSNSKALKILGWKPLINIEKGIKEIKNEL